MDPTRYRTDVARILDAASSDTAARLRRFAEAATDDVIVDVFVDQDGEGPFDVWVRFDGPEGFALDRRFDDERHVFGVEWGEEGWTPEVPARPRGWSRDDLEAQIVDLVAIWLSGLLPPEAASQNWELAAHDGGLAPRRLVPGTA